MDLYTDASTIILGEKTAYSIYDILPHVRVLRDEGENIWFSALERRSMLNFINTLIENFNLKGDNVDWMAMCSDSDAKALLDLENRVPEMYKSLVTDPPELADLVDAFEALLSARHESMDGCVPLYILGIYWDKLDGVGRNENMRLTDRFMSIIQRAPALDVHFVFCVRESRAMRKYMSFFNHRMASKVLESEAYTVVDDKKPSQMDSEDFAMKYYGTDWIKFKLYQSPIRGEVAERVLKI